MRTVEDLLRAAVHETAQEITSERVPPVPAPPAPARTRWTRRSWTHPRWRALAPLAAAIAVVAVVVASLALVQLGPARHTTTGTPAADSVPPYYVALILTGNGSCCGGTDLLAPQTVAEVKSTATGTVLATVRPPQPYGTFVLVSGAAGDRTFVLAAQPLDNISGPTAHPSARTQFFLLHISVRASTVAARLTALPIRMAGSVMIEDMSLSPDGSALAVLAGTYSDHSDAGTLHTFNLTSGTGKTWQPSGIGLLGGEKGSSLSWEADGRTLGLNSNGFRLLDTTAPGNNLLTASRLAVPAHQLLAPFWRQALVTPDGRTVLEVLQIVHRRFTQQLDAFSARTGKLERVVHEPPIANTGDVYEQVQWSSPSGDVLLVSGEGGSGPRLPYPGFSMTRLGVLADGHYSSLPWAAGTYLAAW